MIYNNETLYLNSAMTLNLRHTVLVTGGCGYIGSHCIVQLLNAGYSVVVVDNLSNSRSGSLRRVEKITGKSVKFYKIDLVNAAALDAVFGRNKIDSVIHFAASKNVGESMVDPLLYYKNNLITTINLLEAMKKHNVYNLVFSSSCALYGEPEIFPITEKHQIGQTVNVYGQTKFFMEQIIKDCGKAMPSMNVISLRYFNPIGAHPTGFLGEDNTKSYTNLMPLIAQVAAGDRNSLTVFGSDYDTKDGTPIRDYIHIEDLVEGHIIALKKIIKEHVTFKAYNLGVGYGFTVMDIVGHFKEVSGKEVPCNVVGRREGDVPRLVCDPSLAMAELGWSPKKGIKDMCEDFWRWKSMNPKGYLDVEPYPDTPLN